MNNYPTLNNDFTRKEESDKIKSNNSYPTLSNQTPKLSSEQQRNINSAYKAKQGGFITDGEYKSNLAKNGVKTWEEKTPEFKPPKTNLNQTGVPKINTTKVKIPNEKLEQERLRDLTGQWDLKKVKEDELDNHIRLKNKRPDDYYREIVDDKEQQKRLDEAFGAKTNFSLSNYENNYDKFNQEEKEMFTHKMQVYLNKKGYTGKDGYHLKYDGILGPNTKKALEDYKKDNYNDYKEAVESRNIRTANYTNTLSRDETRDIALMYSRGTEREIMRTEPLISFDNNVDNKNVRTISQTPRQWLEDGYKTDSITTQEENKIVENIKNWNKKTSEKNSNISYTVPKMIYELINAKEKYLDAQKRGDETEMLTQMEIGKYIKAMLKITSEYLTEHSTLKEKVDRAITLDKTNITPEESFKNWGEVFEHAAILSSDKRTKSDALNEVRGINYALILNDIKTIEEACKGKIKDVNIELKNNKKINTFTSENIYYKNEGDGTTFMDGLPVEVDPNLGESRGSGADTFLRTNGYI